MSDAKICFVIAPIGEAGSPVRKRSDQVLKHIITPVCEARGYKAIRADHIDRSGMITNQIIQHIMDDPLVIADLTGRNANVFYELSLRHAIRKPCIHMIEDDEEAPFDVTGLRMVRINMRDPDKVLDSVEEAKERIIGQIESIQAAPSSVESPISIAVDLQALGRSGDPEQRVLGQILEGLSNLQQSVLEVRGDVVRLDPTGWSAFLRRASVRGRGGAARIVHPTLTPQEVEAFGGSYDDYIRAHDEPEEPEDGPDPDQQA
jgi:hypothetical protein